jgi:peptidoglycan-associated lipoprotein
MRAKFLTMAAAALLLTACESSSDEDANAAGAGKGGVGMAGQAKPGSSEDFAVNVGYRVFFGFDRSDLTPEGRARLDRQAAWLRQYPTANVSVEGHCDERGTREYNLALGERRAMAVKNYLVAAGIDAARIETISYGKERPAVMGTGETSWSQNRRGVTVVR